MSHRTASVYPISLFGMSHTPWSQLYVVQALVRSAASVVLVANTEFGLVMSVGGSQFVKPRSVRPEYNPKLPLRGF